MNQEVVIDVVNMSSGVLATLIKQDVLDSPINYKCLDMVHESFVQFCSQLDEKKLDHWVEAWSEFVKRKKGFIVHCLETSV